MSVGTRVDQVRIGQVTLARIKKGKDAGKWGFAYKPDDQWGRWVFLEDAGELLLSRDEMSATWGEDIDPELYQDLELLVAARDRLNAAEAREQADDRRREDSECRGSVIG